MTLQPSAYVELTGYLPGSSPPWLIPETRAFIAPRVSGFVEMFFKRLYGMAEVRADRGGAPADRPLEVRIEQLFARVSPSAALDLHLQLGKFISPFGNYPARSHTSADPFIRPPLNYDYRTLIVPKNVPRSTERFVAWKTENPHFRADGAPIVWAVPYQVGALAFGSWRSVAIRAAIMNSAPSSEPAFWDPWFGEAPGVSYVLHAGLQITPELRIGASYDRGPYLDPTTEDTLLAFGRSPDDYDQEIIALELTATRGLVELRAEAMFDRWEVPRVTDDPRDFSFFTELKWKAFAGIALAARYGQIDFNENTDEAGRTDEWDFDVERWQLGAHYRLTERMDVRTELMLNRGGRPGSANNLLAFQVSRTF